MNKINSEWYTTRFWCTKNVFWPDEQWYLFKYFKKDCVYKPYPFEKQCNVIKKKRKYIRKIIPETELIKCDDGSYCIKQKFIEWKLLKNTNINQLSLQVLSDLLELFEWYMAYCKDEWVDIDVLWCQHDINKIENIRKKRGVFYSRLLNGFLSSTNIMISNDNKVYMIDVCDAIPIHAKNQWLRIVKNAIRKVIIELWIKRTESKIRHIIKEKKNELVDILS